MLLNPCVRRDILRLLAFGIGGHLLDWPVESRPHDGFVVLKLWGFSFGFIPLLSRNRWSGKVQGDNHCGSICRYCERVLRSSGMQMVIVSALAILTLCWNSRGDIFAACAAQQRPTNHEVI